EVSVSLTINTDADISGLLEDLKKVADVEVKQEKAIIAIICDVGSTSSILADGFKALNENGINVQMISQGASKVNISVLVDEDEADKTVTILHKAYFG
ncbi:MAG: ACT domain-containing protein, partial [Treponema porcinum]|nr:ACT domain-containing protein [Treponema porcinum]